VAANPSKAMGLNYQFATSTSNSTLRGHLQKYHDDEYTRLKQERGWQGKLPRMQALELSRQSTLDSVVQAGVENRVKYSKPALLRHLIDFIVADDQVCSFPFVVVLHNLINCSQ
jgi:hypothetical protein